MKNVGRFLGAVSILFSVSQSYAIKDGRPADPVKSRSTILLDLREYGGQRACSGVVMAPNLILVAGHCLDSSSGRNMPREFMGEITNSLRVQSGGSRINIVKWNRPSGYREKNVKSSAETQVDLGYLVVEENLFRLLRIDASQIPTIISDPKELEAILATKPLATTYGYGFSRRPFGTMSTTSRYDFKNEISQHVSFNAGTRALVGRSAERNRGVCDGDSGGGLIVDHGGKQRLLGILSGIGIIDGTEETDDCGAENMRSLYVNLANYSCWIQKDSGVNLGLSCR